MITSIDRAILPTILSGILEDFDLVRASYPSKESAKLRGQFGFLNIVSIALFSALVFCGAFAAVAWER